jgi:hypothetical protein
MLAEPSLATGISPRMFDAVDEFVAALSEAARVTIPVVEGELRDAPKFGFVILFHEPPLVHPLEIGPRIILINADRSTVQESLELHQLACAVEKHRYFEWRTRRSEDTGQWLFGRKDVVCRMGFTLSSGPPPTEHYGLIETSDEKDLPSLIARYLQVYASGVPEGP